MTSQTGDVTSEGGQTCLVVAFDLPPRPNAGARRIGRLVTAAIRAFPGRVTVLAPRNSAPIDGSRALRFRAPIPRSSQSPVLRLLQEVMIGIDATVRLSLMRPDLLLISSPLFVPTLIVTWMCRRLGIRYVVDVRDPYPGVYVAADLIRPDGLVAWLLTRLVLRMYEGAALVTAATRGLASGVRCLSPDSRVVALRNGYSELATASHPAAGRFTLACHGNFGAFQDVALLADVTHLVLQRREDVDALIIGRGPGRAQLEAVLAPQVAEGRVRILSEVPHDEMRRLLSGAHLGLSLRKDDEVSRDSFPVRVTDYLSLGLPVIITPPSEAGRVAHRIGVGRQFDNCEAREIVRYVLDLAEEGDEYQTIRSRVEVWRPYFAQSNTMRRADDLIRWAAQS